MDIKSCCVLIFLYNVDLSVAGCWVEGTIKKKEKKKKRKRTGKHFVMLWGVTRCNFWCQVVWVLPQFSILYFLPHPHPNTSQCLFVCLFVCFLTAAYCFSETPLTFLKLHGSMSQMVSIDQHFIPFGSENERKTTLSTQTCDVKS